MKNKKVFVQLPRPPPPPILSKIKQNKCNSFSFFTMGPISVKQKYPKLFCR